jgi:hypothetical protein
VEPDHSTRSGQTVEADPIRGTARSVRGSAPALAQRIVDISRGRIPSYRDATVELLAEAEGWAEEAVSSALDLLTGDLSHEGFVDRLTEDGRRRAARGFPLTDILVANLVETQTLWEAFIDASPTEPEARVQAQTAFTEAALAMLQTAVAAVSSGYLEVEGARVADEEHDMQSMIESLAGLRTSGLPQRVKASQRGIDIDAIRWCVAAPCPDSEVGSTLRSFRTAVPDMPVGRIGEHLIAFARGDEPPRIDMAPIGIAAALDAPASYRRAVAALKVAQHLERDAVLYDDVVPLALILSGPEEDRRAFVAAQLGPLIEDPLGEELMRSLRSYYRSGQSIAAAARDLDIHRHTLEYRLQRVENALDTDIRAPDNRLLLELALSLRPGFY